MKRIVGIGLVMASLAAGTIAGCLETGEGSENFTEDGKLGTKATYDNDSGQILVSFAEQLEEGQALYLSVRRADLQDPSYAAKDCAQVAERPIAIFGAGQADKGELGDAAREAHGERTIYRLPLEDKSLLVNPYSDTNLPSGQSWGQGDLTGEKQAILDKGVDTFIDICVTQDGAVLRREQVDLYLAMDLNNPHLVRDAMAADEAGAVSGSDEFDHNQARATSPQKYGEICVAALGEIPFFKNKREAGTDPVTNRPQYTYDTWNCLDSVHIPVTVTKSDGNGGETVEGPDWDEGNGGESDGRKCDKRQYIYNLCEQGPRVISAVNEQGTTWVLLCRKGRGQTPKLVQDGVDAQGNPIMKNTVAEDQLSSKYNDVAMLGHNPRTGRTCFFQNALYSRTDGSKVPHPADVEKWQNIWSGVHGAQGGINCNNCHDQDPFILTPWIAGAKRNEVYKKAQQKMSGSGKNGWVADVDLAGATVVPMYGVHPDFPLKDLTVPYTLVNYIGQSWTHEKQLVGDKVKACSSCHRIGAGNGLAKWELRSVGLDSAYDNMITDAYKNDWKRHHYMPFDPRPGQPDPLPANQAAWDASPFKTAIDYIKQCQSAPQDGSSTDCQFKDIPREAAGIDPGGGGECHSPIPDDCDY